MGGVRGCTLRVAARRQIVSPGGDFGRFRNVREKKPLFAHAARASKKLNRGCVPRVPAGARQRVEVGNLPRGDWRLRR